MTLFDALLRHLSEEHANTRVSAAGRSRREFHGGTGSTRAWRAFLYAVAATGAFGNSRFVRGPTRAA
jgi:hypothetical protein